MKKHLLIALSLTLLTTSCSGNNDDDNNTQQTNNPVITQYFHPPTWIQGTWGVTNGTSTNKLYKFTADDFIMITGTSELSMTGTIKSTPNGGSVDETANNGTQYNFTVKYNITNTTQNFEFRKVSATQIQWKDNSNGTWVDLLKM
jgi:hypothetical protein